MEDKTANRQRGPESSTRLIGIVGTVSIIVGAVFWVATINHFPPQEFVFRPLALLPLSAVLANVSLIIFLYRKIQLTEVGFWFLAFLGTLAAWSFTEFMQRISASEALAIAWRLPAIFAWSVMPIMYLFFVLSYVDKQHLIRRLHFQVGIFLVVTGLVYAQFTSDFVISSQYILQPWGYDSPNGLYLSLFGAWLTTYFLAALYLFIHEYRQSVSIKRRKQIQIFIIGLAIPLVGGLCTDIILPIFGNNILPMAAFLTSVQGAVLSYGIFRHGLFNINPVILSSEIVKTLPQPVIVTDSNFEIQFMNANASDMFSSYKPFFGKNIKDIVGNENYKNIKQEMDDTRDGDITNVERIPLGFKEGVVIAQAKIKLVPESGGYIFGLSNITQQVLSMRVIEKEVRMRTQLYNQERARLLASVNGLRQGFLIVDDNHKINLINKQAQKMFPIIKVSDVQSGHVVDGSRIESLDKYMGDFNLNEKLGEAVKNNQYASFDDITFGSAILDIEIIPIVVEGGAIGAVVLLEDVTEGTLMERSKDEFLSIASHELRTPLTAIRGNTSMVLSYYAEQLKDSDLKEMITDIHDSSQRLIEIVNDFLDTSRLEQGRMEFNLLNFKLPEVIGPVVKDTQMVAKERGNIIKVDQNIDILPAVYADQDKLKQILYNLIGNSIKFTEKGSITISALAQDGFVKVSVKDSGRGISEEGQKLLFRKFQQTGSSILTRDATRGTGLGLYISRMLVENMGGAIVLDSSKPGVGSIFSFTIPLAKNNVS